MQFFNMNPLWNAVYYQAYYCENNIKITLREESIKSINEEV